MATILESFVGNYLLNKLVTFVEGEVAKIFGVKDEFKKLEKKIRRIRVFLKDAERRRITDVSVNHWLSELKDVIYDVDDLIDLWIYTNKYPTKNSSASANLAICCTWISCVEPIKVRAVLARQILSLNARLQEIFEEMQHLQLQYIEGEVRELTRVEAYVSTPIFTEVDIVGNEIEEGAKKLVKMAIMDNEENVNLVAITGMGGIGKTALAQKMYNDNTIQNKYSIRIWLRVSQSYSPSQLIKDAIRNAGGNPGMAERKSELLPILAKAILGKSCFLVLDDVWNPDLWVNLLQYTVKGNATRVFILVTTRDQTIATQMGAKHIHQATILSTKSGLDLLCKRAYLTDPTDIQNLKAVGVEIVEKCGNLPLAIITIAGVLATKSRTMTEWENVLRNHTWSINGLPSEINRALYFSYEDLSSQLKQCFLYCSLYPSNQQMHYRDIVEDWIAEGFIEYKEDQAMEVEAEECYNELCRRHLLELEPSFVDNSRCRMHNLLRLLAQYLSSAESLCKDQILWYIDNISKLRRLFITEINEPLIILDPAIKQLKLRTFQIAKCLYETESQIFKKLKYLRVLTINGKGLHKIPQSIGDLIHLRKLDLSHTCISNLPDSVSLLRNLLFLNVSGCEFLHKLPGGVTRLSNLRHLNLLDTPLTSVPREIGVLRKLTELWGFQVGGNGGHEESQNGWDIQQLEMLSQLRRIGIIKLERAKNVTDVLANKTHLIELTLHFSKVLERVSRQVEELQDGTVEELEDERSKKIVEMLRPPRCIENLRINNYPGRMLPNWMSSSPLEDFLPNLIYLRLTDWSCCTNLPPLGLLPNLKYLKIIGASSIVKISLEFLGIGVRHGPNLPVVFLRLEHLIFEDMLNWEEWELSEFKEESSPTWQLMPQIKHLAIIKCPKLRALPDGLQQLSAVKELIVRETNSIRSLENFRFECDDIFVENNQCIEVLSNLPGVRRLNVSNTPNLRHVSKLDSLDHIKITNFSMTSLPTWLITLINQRKRRSKYDLHLELSCSTALLQRCLKGGQDWPIIKRFSSVSVYNVEQDASLQYTKEPESYYASIGTGISNTPTQNFTIGRSLRIYVSLCVCISMIMLWCMRADSLQESIIKYSGILAMMICSIILAWTILNDNTFAA